MFFCIPKGTPTNSPRHGRSQHQRHDIHHHHESIRHSHDNAPCRLREVTCTVAHIKVRFHGGAAMICQFLTSLYIKMYKRHLEAQVFIFILISRRKKNNKKFYLRAVIADKVYERSVLNYYLQKNIPELGQI